MMNLQICGFLVGLHILVLAFPGKLNAQDFIELRAEAGGAKPSDHVTLDQDFTFKVPGQINLESGRSGDIEGELSFSLDRHRKVRCKYELEEKHRKKASPHGKKASLSAPEMIPLEHCNFNIRSGSLVTTRSLALKIGKDGHHGHSDNVVISVRLANEHPSGPQQVTIPTLIGLSKAAATGALTNIGLVAGTITQSYSNAVAKDLVMNQDPLAGAKVLKGSAVNFALSLGQELVTVPDITSLSQSAAEALIISSRLAIGKVSRSDSSSIPKDAIISQSPNSGLQVVVATVVDFVISDGPPIPQLVLVPSLDGMTQGSAAETLTALKLTVGTVSNAYSSTIAPNLIISQQPAVGSQVLVGSAVDLVVSLGIEQVSVPYVLDLSQSAAESLIIASRLSVGQISGADSLFVPQGNVIAQSPLASHQVDVASTVDITISNGPPVLKFVSTPSLVGLDQSTASRELTRLELSLGTISFAYSSSIPKNLTISHQPSVGVLVVVGSFVDLVISMGVEQVEVPNLLGLLQDAAEAQITASRLSLGQISTASSQSVPKGHVISQTPGAGQQAALASTVDIVISDGPPLIGGDEIVDLPYLESENTFEQCRKENLPNPSQNGEGPQTQFYDAYSFIFSGNSPVQFGLTEKSISKSGISVIWGRLRRANHQPIAGVRIEVQNHPEFGYTLSGNCGEYYLAVEGPGEYVLKYQGDNLLKSFRNVSPKNHEFTRLDDVILKPFDAAVTTLDLSGLTKTAVVQGSTIVDQDGERIPRIFFPPGTTATVTRKDGSQQVLDRISVRITEATVGPDGPKSMPATLPPMSAYTYAADLSIDEAVDAKLIQFNREIPFYLDNFLHMPTGTIIPVGYYNQERGVWEGLPNGLIISIVGFNNQLPDIDLTGDGVAEDSAKLLAALGMDEDERRTLYETYQSAALPKELWRATTDHFSYLDLNFSNLVIALKSIAIPIVNEDNADCASRQIGSVIECDNRGLGEEIPVAGTSNKLIYRSKRMDSAEYNRSITIDVVAPDIGTSELTANRATIEISIAGRQIVEYKDLSSSDIQYHYEWDGLDVFGRKVEGSQIIELKIVYEYINNYQLYSDPAQLSRLRNYGMARWGSWPCGWPCPGQLEQRSRQPTYAVAKIRKRIGQPNPRNAGFGGWTLSENHYLEPSSDIVHFGDGNTQSQSNTSRQIVKNEEFTKQPFRPAFGAQQEFPLSAQIGPDGRLYWLSMGGSPPSYSIDAINRDGVIEHILGDPTNPDRTSRSEGSIGNKTVFTLERCHDYAVGANHFPDFAFGPDNSLYFADCPRGFEAALIRKLDLASKKVSTVVGNLQASIDELSNPLSGNGGQALQMGLASDGLLALTVDSSGTIYFNHRGTLRRVTLTGFVELVAGGGSTLETQVIDGSLATSNKFSYIMGVQVDSKGTVFFSSKFNIFKLEGADILSRVAGNFASNDSRDGQLATDTRLSIENFRIRKDDKIFFTDFTQSSSRIRTIMSNGVITSIAGSTNIAAPAPMLGNASQSVRLQSRVFSFDTEGSPTTFIAVAEKDPVYDYYPSNWYLVSFKKNTGVMSSDGNKRYVFDDSGQHIKTVDSLTGAALLAFAYDVNNQLSSLTDSFGNVTEIKRDAVTGLATEIVAPFGQTTRLGYSPGGLLTEVTNPKGASNIISYHVDGDGKEIGLIDSFRSLNGFISRYAFDKTGRLESATDPQNFTKTLSGTNATDGSQSVIFSSPLGKQMLYINRTDESGKQSHLISQPTGFTIETKTIPGISTSSTDSTYVTTTSTLNSDPRFGIQKPYASSVSVTNAGASTLYKLTTKKSGTGLVRLGDPTFATLTTTSQINDDPNRIFKEVTNASQRTITSTSPMGFQGITHYSLLSQVTASETSGTHPQRFDYDSKGRLLASYWGPQGCLATTPNCRVTEYQYIPVGQDGAGLLGGMTGPESSQVSLRRDILGQITSMSNDPAGLNLISNLSYDSAGNVTSVSPAGKPAHRLDYDSRDLNFSYNPPDVLGGGTPDFNQYEYDADRFLTRELLPDAAAPLAIQYKYNSGGELIAKTTPEGVFSYTYDPTKAQLTGVTAPNGSTIGLHYIDSLIFNEEFRLPNSAIIFSLSVAHDDEFRISRHSIAGENIAYSYDYDGFPKAAGDLKIYRNAQNGMLAGSELASGPNKIETAYEYDGFRDLLRSTTKFNGTTLLDVSYGHDKLSRITSRDELRVGGGESLGFAYDRIGRLAGVAGDSVESFTYDANGNRLSNGAVYDDQDRLLNNGNSSYIYTGRGSLMEKRDSATGTSTRYSYSSEGELKSVNLADGKIVQYESDGLGRRVLRSYNGDTLGFLYKDQLEPIADVNGDGTVRSVYVYGDKAHVPSYMIRGGEKFAIVSDERGSVRMVVAMATGIVSQEMRYDAWGQVLMDSNPGFQPFGYAGGIYDAVTGLVRFGARDYDAGVGRWLSKDRSGFRSAANFYSYAANSPVNMIDTTGLDEVDVKIAWEMAREEAPSLPPYEEVNFVYALPNFTDRRGITVSPINTIILRANYSTNLDDLARVELAMDVYHESLHYKVGFIENTRLNILTNGESHKAIKWKGALFWNERGSEFLRRVKQAENSCPVPGR
jgi:RHS repeat-associated protein